MIVKFILGDFKSCQNPPTDEKSNQKLDNYMYFRLHTIKMLLSADRHSSSSLYNSVTIKVQDFFEQSC